MLQRRLPPIDAAAVRALFEFGQAIGNTDMHFGNLSLWCDDPAKAQFALAPVHDMLPMRWRPDGFQGLQDYSPFEPPPPRRARGDAEQPASPRRVAAEFWQRASHHTSLSRPLRAVAEEMAARLAG